MNVPNPSSSISKVAVVSLTAGLFCSTPSYAAVTLLEAAGGGGGALFSLGGGPPPAGGPGQVTTSGGSAIGPGGGAGGVGGLGGEGGAAPADFNGAGGGGWLGPGINGVGSGPLLPNGSGYGGLGPPTFAGGLGGNVPGGPDNGGFGGGGGGGAGGGGGGGGYSGGGGGSEDGGGVGGGGGSYVSPLGTLVTAAAGVNGVDNGLGRAGANGEVEIDGIVFNYTGTIQNYVVPTTGVYDIQAWGAQGGSAAFPIDIGGYGAYIDADFYLTAGMDLEIVVGGAGLGVPFTSGDGFFSGGGGGGSFVWTVIPEPSTWTLMFTGFAGLAFASYRRTRGRLTQVKA